MWNFISSGVLSIAATVTDWATTTVALLLLLGAIAFYVYSFIDRRIPGVVVAPVIGVLVFASAYIYGSKSATEYEREQCDLRSQRAQEELNRRTLEAATKIKGLEQELSRQRMEMATQNNLERQELLEEITRLEAQEKLETEEDAKNNPTIVYLPGRGCLSTTVPDSLLQSINKAGRSNSTNERSR